MQNTVNGFQTPFKLDTIYSLIHVYHLYTEWVVFKYAFVCIFSWKEICVLDYFSYVKYEDLCATITFRHIDWTKYT